MNGTGECAPKRSTIGRNRNNTTKSEMQQYLLQVVERELYILEHHGEFGKHAFAAVLVEVLLQRLAELILAVEQAVAKRYKLLLPPLKTERPAGQKRPAKAGNLLLLQRNVKRTTAGGRAGKGTEVTTTGCHTCSTTYGSAMVSTVAKHTATSPLHEHMK